MLSILKNSISKIDKKTLENFGFTNVPDGEWAIKTGSVSYSDINSNNNRIPIGISITVGQNAGTPEAWVKYGTTKIFSVKPYEYTWSAVLFTGRDLSKKSISVSNIWSCNVTTWLEKVGGEVTRKLRSLLVSTFRKKVLTC